MASTTGFTIEDFESLPAALARNHELLDGELVDVSVNGLGRNSFRPRFSMRIADVFALI